MLKADPSTITLTDRDAACTFERVPDDVVRAVVGEDIWQLGEYHGPRGTLTITAIDNDAGVITFDPSPAVYSGPLGALRPVQR